MVYKYPFSKFLTHVKKVDSARGPELHFQSCLNLDLVACKCSLRKPQKFPKIFMGFDLK